jgi:hypothetical protein
MLGSRFEHSIDNDLSTVQCHNRFESVEFRLGCLFLGQDQFRIVQVLRI